MAKRKETLLELMAKKAAIDAEIRRRRIYEVNKRTIATNCSLLKLLRKQLEAALLSGKPGLIVDDLLDKIEAQLGME